MPAVERYVYCQSLSVDLTGQKTLVPQLIVATPWPIAFRVDVSGLLAISSCCWAWYEDGKPAICSKCRQPVQCMEGQERITGGFRAQESAEALLAKLMDPLTATLEAQELLEQTDSAVLLMGYAAERAHEKSKRTADLAYEVLKSVEALEKRGEPWGARVWEVQPWPA